MFSTEFCQHTEVTDKSRRHDKPSANGFGWAYDKRYRPKLGPYHAFLAALNLFADQQNKSSLQTSLASGKRGNFESNDFIAALYNTAIMTQNSENFFLVRCFHDYS